jgi:predicted enzyme related to lactoylglutathione lyase
VIKAIKFVSIPVEDQDRALDFYTRTLVFTIVTDQPFNGSQRWIELRIPGADTGVVLFTPPGQEDRVGSFMNMSFTCDDVQKTFDELSARGVEFVQPPKTEGWGTAAIFKDTEGNSFVLSSR